MQNFRILIADDHEAVRRSIRVLLQDHAQWEIAGEAKDGREAVDLARSLEPDLVLLDVSMPNMNGLDALREIRRQLPDTPVLILTMHKSDQLNQEAERLGAQGVISKSEAYESLIAAIESLASAMPIHLGDSVVGHRHIAALFHSEDERYRVLGPFITEGLARREKAVHIIDPPARELHVRRLMEHGVDAERAEAQRCLDLRSWEAVYLRGGRFDQDAMLALMREILEEGSANAFPLTRLIAHMEWALEDRPGVHDLVEYEARFNLELAEIRDVVICAYDLTRFPANVIVDVMCAHPAVLIGGSLRENPFYMPRPVSQF